MNTAKRPPPLINTNSLRGALIDSKYCRASAVGVVKILLALDNKYRDGEFQVKVCRSDGFYLKRLGANWTGRNGETDAT